MNTSLISNVSLFVLAVGALTKAVELLTSKDFITGAALFVAGLILVFVYEKYPPTVPPQP